MISTQEQVSEALSTTMPGSDLLLLEKKFEYILDIQTKKLKNEIESMKQQQNSLYSEIESLKKQMQKASFSSIAAEHNAQQGSTQNIPIVAVGSAKLEQETKELGSSANSTTQARPRFGDYKSGDVSVEKMFYFGSKR